MPEVTLRGHGSTEGAALEYQTCKDCGERHPLTRDHFGQYKNERNGEVRIGFRNTCRRCMAARSARHAAENPDQKRDAARRRQQRETSGTSLLSSDILKLRALLGDACRYCGDALHGVGELDHLTPVARGGSGRKANLTLACTPCNRSKLAKTLDEFLAWRAERGLPIRAAVVPGERPDPTTSEVQRRTY